MYRYTDFNRCVHYMLMFFVIYLQHLAGFRASTVTMSAGAAEPVVRAAATAPRRIDWAAGLEADRELASGG